MILANMVKVDRDGLLCDMAKTYHIYALNALPLSTTATLAVGLPMEARIYRKLSGQEMPLNTLLLAGIYDGISLLLWSKTKDGEKNRNRPKSLLKSLTQKPDSTVKAFRSPEEFERVRKKIMTESR